jgi:hypothetical protein
VNHSFEVNLLSQVQAPDKKLSLSQDRATLKRKTMRDGKRRESGGMHRTPVGEGDRHENGEVLWDDETDERTIDLTV